jgi:hypothetical protein
VKLRARIEAGIRCAGHVFKMQDDRLRRIARMPSRRDRPENPA